MAFLQGIFHSMAPAIKSAGRALDNVGASMEAVRIVESVTPSTKIMSYTGIMPTISENVFVAPTASVMGKVSIGQNSSVWYGAKIRGDVHDIVIGSNTSIGDCVMVHSAKIQGDHATSIGDNVTVGANAIVHACNIKSNVIVGMGAQILDGAVVESHSVIAPGALVTPGKVVSSGQLWSGSPAKHLRDLTEAEKSAIGVSACESSALSMLHCDETSKDYKQVMKDEELAEDDLYRSPDYLPRLDPELAKIPVTQGGTLPHSYAINDRKATSTGANPVV
jgi:carbonic anhydrase/acetyltransferase-like protein (isoleucine patch superfamily)